MNYLLSKIIPKLIDIISKKGHFMSSEIYKNDKDNKSIIETIPFP